MNTKDNDRYKSVTKQLPPDSLLISKKVDSIVEKFNKVNYPLVQALKSELIDLNYDGKKDLVIHYYGMAGTGLKNRIAVYFYDQLKSNFAFDKELSLLMNPSFYLAHKMITSFYVANGGGDGLVLQWSGTRWDTLKYFVFTPASNQDEDQWEVKMKSDYRDTVFYTNRFVVPDTSLIPNEYK